MAKGTQILVSDATMGEAECDFRFTGPFSVSVKGKRTTQRVWLLSGAAAEE
jgi:class 3 adenylate cyclase